MIGPKLPDESYEFIKGEVAFILSKCKIRCIPISGFEIAMKLGIILRPYSSLSTLQREAAMKTSTDGFFIEDNVGRSIIYYNDAKSYERVNMTILHEIGHCVLDHGVEPNSRTDIEEAEARFFAKYIAAPPPLIDRIHPESEWDIMEWFSISWEAASYAFDYYKKWKQIKKSHGIEAYEETIVGLFATQKNGIRRRLSSYRVHMHSIGGDYKKTQIDM